MTEGGASALLTSAQLEELYGMLPSEVKLIPSPELPGIGMGSVDYGQAF